MQTLHLACCNNASLFAGSGGAEVQAASSAALAAATQSIAKDKKLCEWRVWQDGLQLLHQHDVERLCWHARGDYFASICPLGNTRVSPVCSRALA